MRRPAVMGSAPPVIAYEPESQCSSSTSSQAVHQPAEEQDGAGSQTTDASSWTSSTFSSGSSSEPRAVYTQDDAQVQYILAWHHDDYISSSRTVVWALLAFCVVSSGQASVHLS